MNQLPTRIPWARVLRLVGFILEILLALYVQCWTLFWIVLFERANRALEGKDKTNYPKLFQDFICALFMHIYTKLTTDFSHRLAAIFVVWCLDYIKMTVDLINSLVVEFENLGILSEKGGWISLYRIIATAYHLSLLFAR
jgi:hypothetical protein